MTAGLETAAFALELFDKIEPNAKKAFLSQIGTAISNVRGKFEVTFSSHIEATLLRCKYVKTLFSNDEAVDIESIYVSLRLKNDKTVVQDVDIIDIFKGYKRVVIVGTGGAGKSMILRYLAQKISIYPNGTVPFFIELRDLVDHKPSDFYRALLISVLNNATDGQHSLFQAGLRSGIFTLFLDGLDEVPPDRRALVYKSIQRIGLDFPKTRVVASTRPELNLAKWESFDRFELVPLDKSQVVQLVKKVDHDDIIKNRFLLAIEGGLYEKHESFLGIPLLCSLMLFIYSDALSIPEKSTLFFEQAFITLQKTHDRSKGYYKREYASKLEEDKFLYLLSALCFRTLARGEVSFYNSQLLEHIEKSSALCGIDVNIDDYADDLVSSLCLLIQDGLKFHFIHRSFQEFFAAKFALRYRVVPTFELFNMLVQGINNRSIAMAAELDIQTVETEWALPTLELMLSAIGQKSTLSSLKKLLNFLQSEIVVKQDVNSERKTAIVDGPFESIDVFFALDQVNFEISLTLEFIRVMNALSEEVDYLVGLCADQVSEEGRKGGKMRLSILVKNIPITWFRSSKTGRALRSFDESIREMYNLLKFRVESYSKIDILN